MLKISEFNSSSSIHCTPDKICAGFYWLCFIVVMLSALRRDLFLLGIDISYYYTIDSFRAVLVVPFTVRYDEVRTWIHDYTHCFIGCNYPSMHSLQSRISILLLFVDVITYPWPELGGCLTNFCEYIYIIYVYICIYWITSAIKCRMKLLIHSQTSTVQPLKFGNVYVISSNTLLAMWLLIHAGVKVNPC